MSVQIASGDLLEQRVDAIVNTVNTIGVMGKGIALQFKRRWPANAKAYETACKRGDVVPGKMFLFDNGGLVDPKFIINFRPSVTGASRLALRILRPGWSICLQW